MNIYGPGYIKQIISKGPPQSIENSTQYSVIKYIGKELKKEYIYVKLNHLAIHLKAMKLCKSNMFQYKIKIKLKHFKYFRKCKLGKKKKKKTVPGLEEVFSSTPRLK